MRQKLKSKKRSHNKKRIVYSINFFYYFSEYDHDFLNWYYNDIPYYLFGKMKPSVKNAVVKSVKKAIEVDDSIQLREAKYYVYYRRFNFKKKKISLKDLKSIRKKIPNIVRLYLDDSEKVYDELKKLHLKTAFKKKFKKQIKNKKPIDTFEIFKFFVRKLTKKYKLRRVSKKWRIEDYKFLTLRR